MVHAKYATRIRTALAALAACAAMLHAQGAQAAYELTCSSGKAKLEQLKTGFSSDGSNGSD